jgi:hypothetical protein
VAADGTLSACTSAHTFGLPNSLAVSGGYLYVADAGGPNVYSCTINNADGTLSACITNYVGTVNTLDGIAVTATTAYMVDINGENLTTCSVSPIDGSLFGCTQATLNNSAPLGGNTPNSSPRSASVYGGNLFIGTTASIMILPIAGDGTVTVNYPCALTTTGTSCTIDGIGPVQTPVTGLAFNNGHAYASGAGSGGGIGVCTIEASGIIDSCTTNLTGYYGGMAVH